MSRLHPWKINNCDGHPAGPFDPMGLATFCDGSCQPRYDLLDDDDDDDVLDSFRSRALAVTAAEHNGSGRVRDNRDGGITSVHTA